MKESVEDPTILKKIQDVIIPQEFTRVDGIIDLVFSTAEDVQQEDDEHAVDAPDSVDHKPKFVPVSFNEACAVRISSHINKTLLRKSRATFLSADESVAVVCSVSREQKEKANPLFWFAFHPYQATALEDRTTAYVAFGCGSEEMIVMVPYMIFKDWMDSLWTTERNGSHYWHVHLSVEGKQVLLRRKKGFEDIDVSKYLL